MVARVVAKPGDGDAGLGPGMNDDMANQWTRRGVIAAAAVTGAGTTAAAGSAMSQPGPAPSAQPDVARLPAAQVTPPWRDEGFVATGSGRIHWAAMGDGPVVLLLPKLGGWIADWRHVAPLLADSNRVIVMDPPGHGGSTMAVQPPFILTQEESAAMIAKAMDVLGVDHYAIVGNSMGGSIGLVMSVLWPQRVSRLAMVSTAIPAAIPLADIVASPDNRVFVGEYTYDKAVAIFGSSRQTYEDHVRSIKADWAWLNAGERGVRRAGLLDYFTRTPTAPLMIYGERSGAGYRAFLPELQRRRPDMKVAQIADAGSFAHQDNPSGTAKVLKDFLGAG